MNFERLKSLLNQVDNVFSKMAGEYPAEINCKAGCDDCCHACFDVSLAEVEYIREGMKTLEDQQVAQIKNIAEQAKLEIVRLKAEVDADPTKEIHQEISNWRVRCPLLGDNKECVLYKYRPMTCRVYGLPTSIGSKGHVCGFTGFEKGISYPTVKLDQIFEYLQSISQEVAEEAGMPEDEAKSRRFLYGIFLEK
jgi:Fe-S-cluster containining protein